MATRGRFTFRLANRIVAGLAVLGSRASGRAPCRLPVPDSIREFSIRASRRAELIGRLLDERPSRRSAAASAELRRPFLFPVPAAIWRSSTIPLPLSTGAAEAKRMEALVRSCSLVLIGDLASTERCTYFGAVCTTVVDVDRTGDRARDAARDAMVEVAKRIEGVSTTSAVG